MMPASLPGWFGSFLLPGVDRPSFLKQVLAGGNVPSTTVTIGGKTHLIAAFGRAGKAFPVPLVLVAHHDREKGTPGANDNSAACALLVEFAIAYGKEKRGAETRQLFVVFSGGEEASSGVASQGAYGLATGLRQCGIKAADCIVLDGIGRGDTIILSESSLLMFVTQASRDSQRFKDVQSLDARIRIALDSAAKDGWMSLPTPFSDNAGLISGGLSACCLSVLPRTEAVRYGSFIRDRPRIILDSGYHDLSRDTIASPFIPETWKRFHSKHDTIESLDGMAQSTLFRFLMQVLC